PLSLSLSHPLLLGEIGKDGNCMGPVKHSTKRNELQFAGVSRNTNSLAYYLTGPLPLDRNKSATSGLQITDYRRTTLTFLLPHSLIPSLSQYIDIHECVCVSVSECECECECECVTVCVCVWPC